MLLSRLQEMTTTGSIAGVNRGLFEKPVRRTGTESKTESESDQNAARNTGKKKKKKHGKVSRNSCESSQPINYYA